jgi:hypothetical protein
VTSENNNNYQFHSRLTKKQKTFKVTFTNFMLPSNQEGSSPGNALPGVLVPPVNTNTHFVIFK